MDKMSWILTIILVPIGVMGGNVIGYYFRNPSSNFEDIFYLALGAYVISLVIVVLIYLFSNR